jgi:HlyD family secretion protein
MTSPGRAEKRRDSAGRTPYRMVGTAVLVAAVGLVVIWFRVVHGGEDPASGVATFAARRGPLTISVLEAGVLKAKDPAIVRSSMRRRATIVSIVPEGTRVKEGDLLVELDVSELVDHLVDHEIMVRNAEAALVNARESLTIITSQMESTVELARLNVEFAKQDLEKYTGKGGKYENDVAAAEGKIKLNAEERTKAADYLDWSTRLYSEKYLSKTQLQADQLALQRAELNLQVASNDANLLKQYTHRREITQLTSDVSQAEKALERAEARARASIAQIRAQLAAREQEYRHQVEMLERHKEEVAQSKIYAPTDGMVIYATSSRSSSFHDDRKPLADGVEVWERQELIYLPRSTSTVAEVDLHEANLQKVRVGQPAVVTVDALPGKKLVGTIKRIAPLPDPQSMWMNPDLKVYKTEIALDSNDPLLRSGMNCKAEIVVEQHTDTVYVPIQTIRRVGGRPAVYVLKDDGSTEVRPVELGLDDNRMVRVLGGLDEGELVLLAPPRQTGGVESGWKLAAVRSADDDEIKQRIREKLKTAETPVVWPRAAERRPRTPGPATPSTRDDAGPLPGVGPVRLPVPNVLPAERQREIERMKPKEAGAPASNQDTRGSRQ